MRHEIMRKRAIPCFDASLTIYFILCRRELVQDVKCFNAGYQFPFQERLGNGGIQHKIIRIQFRTAIAAAGIHVSVGRNCRFQLRNRVTGRQPILEVGDIQGFEIEHLALAVPPCYVACGTNIQCSLIILYICAIMQSQGVDRIHMTFGFTRKYDMVEPMSKIAVKLVFHSPMPVVIKGIEDTCSRFNIVCSMYIFRTV